MEIKKISLSDLFAWLLASFRLIGAHPGRFALASAVSIVLVVALAIVLSFVMVLIGDDVSKVLEQNPPDVKALSLFYAGLFLVALVAAPPFIAGWFVYCQKLVTRGEASVSDLFGHYADKGHWGKLIRYGLISMLLYLLAHALLLGVCVALGLSTDDFNLFIEAQLRNDPNALAALPATFWLTYLGFVFLGFVLQTLFMLGFAQAALTDSSAGESLQAGIGGTLKNLPVLLVFLLAMLLLGLLAVMALVVIIVLLVTLLALLNQYLAMLVGALMYVSLVLYLYPLVFSFQYYLWQGMLGEPGTPVANDTSEILL